MFPLIVNCIYNHHNPLLKTWWSFHVHVTSCWNPEVFLRELGCLVAGACRPKNIKICTWLPHTNNIPMSPKMSFVYFRCISMHFFRKPQLWCKQHGKKTWWFPRNLQVPTVIYAEIPEANAWLTGLGVVLGVGQFGLAGVVLGPLLASVPLICCSDWDVSAIFFWFFWHGIKCWEMFGTQSPNMSQHPQCEALFFMAFHCFFCLQITEYHRIDEQRLQLGEAFQHLAVAPGDLHDLFFRQWSLHFDWRRKNPENDRKAIYVVRICNVYIYIYIYVYCIIWPYITMSG